MKRSRFTTFITSSFFAVTWMNTSHAAFVTYLDDPIGTPGIIDVIVGDDQMAGAGTSIGNTTVDDAYAGPGTMTFLGPVGNFTVNVTTGVSKPALGGDVMHLDSVNISGGAGGTLIIVLTDTGFTGAYPGYEAAYSTTTGGTVDFNYFYDATNTEFGGSSIFSTGPIGTGSFSGVSTAATAGNPYTLSIINTIVHGSGSVSTSFDAELTPVPVPAAVWLFGSGLLGLVAIARRKSV